MQQNWDCLIYLIWNLNMYQSLGEQKNLISNSIVSSTIISICAIMYIVFYSPRHYNQYPYNIKKIGLNLTKLN